MTDQTPTPECVSKDIIASAMDLVGYSTEGWAWIYALTAANIVVLALASALFLPLYSALLTTGGVLTLGLVVVIRLVYIQSAYREHTLAVRNSLERRLGLPEHARHRASYVGELEGAMTE